MVQQQKVLTRIVTAALRIENKNLKAKSELFDSFFFHLKTKHIEDIAH